MPKRNTWETKFVAFLLGRRLLVLWVVVGLQLLLAAAIAVLLWFTKVQDSVAAYAVVLGQQTIVLEAARPSAAVEALAHQGDAVAEGQLLARVDGREVRAPVSGVVWGAVFSESEGAEDDRLPLLSVIDPTSIRLRVDVGESDLVFSEGVRASIRLDRLVDTGARPFQGVIMGRVGDGAGALDVLLDLGDEGRNHDYDWSGLGRMLVSGQHDRVLLQVRVRRLLLLLLRR